MIEGLAQYFSSIYVHPNQFTQLEKITSGDLPVVLTSRPRPQPDHAAKDLKRNRLAAKRARKARKKGRK